MNGKIAALPKYIREQLNRRLDADEPRHQLLAWLNSLPETKSLSDPARKPISKQNLSEWTQHGFRAWKMRENALDFATSVDLPHQNSLTASLNDKLVHWLSLSFAASAQDLAPNPEHAAADLRQLRAFAADIVALRRGDLCSRRLALEERRLAILESEREQELDKIEDNHQMGKFMRAKIRANMPEVAGWMPPEDDDEDDSEDLESNTPAALI